MHEKIIKDSLKEAELCLEKFLKNENSVNLIASAASICSEAIKNGNKIISCGNGGSLCDATHFAEELTGRYRNSRRSLPAISINDPAYMTCVGNDFSFTDIFSRYVEGVGHEGDVLLAISTSGHSKNIINATDAAHLKGMKVIALTVEGKNDLSEKADISINAPFAPHSDRIQEIHIKVIHILIQLIESDLNFK